MNHRFAAYGIRPGAITSPPTSPAARSLDRLLGILFVAWHPSPLARCTSGRRPVRFVRAIQYNTMVAIFPALAGHDHCIGRATSPSACISSTSAVVACSRHRANNPRFRLRGAARFRLWLSAADPRPRQPSASRSGSKRGVLDFDHKRCTRCRAQRAPTKQQRPSRVPVMNDFLLDARFRAAPSSNSGTAQGST